LTSEVGLAMAGVLVVPAGEVLGAVATAIVAAATVAAAVAGWMIGTVAVAGAGVGVELQAAAASTTSAHPINMCLVMTPPNGFITLLLTILIAAPGRLALVDRRCCACHILR